MEIDKRTPPRTFTIGQNADIVIRQVADVRLDADEQITLVGDTGSPYDIVRKSWGYYATPSINGRLRAHGLRAALARNAANKVFLLLVETGREDAFHAYLATERQEVICWLDQDDSLRTIAEAFGKPMRTT